MILTVIGGSAQSTPVLLEWLSFCDDRPAHLVVRLVGRNTERLSAVRRACCLLAPDIGLEQFDWENLQQALPPSDIVLIQVRAGGYPGRAFDESFPLSFGVPGDEGLGPGGFSAALRGWPLIRGIIQKCLSVTSNSTILLLTSPGSILVRLAAIEFPRSRIWGICELPMTTLTRLCEATGCRPEDTTFSYMGVNHLGWLYNVRSGARDLVTDYARLDGVPLHQAVAEYGGVPMKYLRLHFEQDLVVKAQKEGDSRSEWLKRLQRDSIICYRDGTLEQIRRCLRLRDASWYTEAVGPLIAAITGQAGSKPLFLSIADEAGEVSEKAYTVSRNGLALLPNETPPTAIANLTGRFVDYERAAAKALLVPSLESIRHALQLHPWVKGQDEATQLAYRMLGEGNIDLA